MSRSLRLRIEIECSIGRVDVNCGNDNVVTADRQMEIRSEELNVELVQAMARSNSEGARGASRWRSFAVRQQIGNYLQRAPLYRLPALKL